MNAPTTLARDLEAARLDLANNWAEPIKPLIETYLCLGEMLDKLEQGFNGWKPTGSAEELMAGVHSALAKSHGQLRRDISDYRNDAIEACMPPRPYARNLTAGEWDRRDEMLNALLDQATSIDAAIGAFRIGRVVS